MLEEQNQAIEARAAELMVELRGMRTGEELKQLLAKTIARLEFVEMRVRQTRDVEPLLVRARYRRRKTDKHLVFSVPGLDGEHRMIKSFLRKARNCATCGNSLPPGAVVYTPRWTDSNWLRDCRICYPCGQKLAPVEGDFDKGDRDDSADLGDGQA